MYDMLVSYSQPTVYEREWKAYKRQWQNDQHNGKGVELWPCGAVYNGEYNNGQKQGKEELKLADGSIYIGDFYENVIHGYGIYKWAGMQYNGQWQYNKMDGYGAYAWDDERKYIGNYKSDKKSGQRKFVWSNHPFMMEVWKMENSMGKVFIRQQKEQQEKENGLMDQELFGLNDYKK